MTDQEFHDEPPTEGGTPGATAGEPAAASSQSGSVEPPPAGKISRKGKIIGGVALAAAVVLAIVIPVVAMNGNEPSEADDAAGAAHPNIGADMKDHPEVYPDGYDQTALGKGYNVLSADYWNWNDVMRNPIMSQDTAVLDSAGLVFKYTTQADGSGGSTEGSAYVNYGSSYDQYMASLTANLNIGYKKGLLGAFNKHINGSFGFSGSQQITNYTRFYEAQIKNIIKQEYIYSDNSVSSDTLKLALAPGFQSAINSVDLSNIQASAESIFDTYGTHVMTQVDVGGRYEFSAHYETFSSSTEASIQAALDWAYKGFKGDGGADYDYSQVIADNNVTISTHSYGGVDDSSFTDVNQIAEDIVQWRGTVAGNPVMMDVADNGIVPIWELSDNPDIANALQQEFERLAANNENAWNNGITTEGPFVKDIYVANAGDAGSAAAILEGQIPIDTDDEDSDGDTTEKTPYVIFDAWDAPDGNSDHVNPYDLNRNAGGDAIYLAYTTTKDSDKAVYDLEVISHGHEDDANDEKSSLRSKGYIVSDVDTNRNSGGNYEFIAYSKDPQYSAEPYPVTGLFIWNSSFWPVLDQALGYAGFNNVGWNQEFVNDVEDLNQEAGGDYIYLLYTRTATGLRK
jgi:hypothetical protein